MVSELILRRDNKGSMLILAQNKCEKCEAFTDDHDDDDGCGQH